MKAGPALAACRRQCQAPMKRIGRMPVRSGADFVSGNRSAVLSSLRAFLPGSQVILLLGSELVELVAHGLELKARDFAVEMLWNDVDLRLHRFMVLHQVFGGKRLVGEAHVHHRGGMPFGGGKIYEPAFAQEVNLAVSLQDIFIDERANFALAAGQFL